MLPAHRDAPDPIADTRRQARVDSQCSPSEHAMSAPHRGPSWRRRRRNHGERKAASSLADAALKRLVPDGRLALTRVQLAWSQSMPLQMQQVAWPAALVGRAGETVIVHVMDNQWLHEMSYLRADLLKRLRGACSDPKIADIRLRVGEIEVLPAAERPPPPPEPSLPAEPERATIDAMQSVRDPALRQAIANARLALGRR